MHFIFPLALTIIFGYISGVKTVAPLGPADIFFENMEQCEEPDTYTHPYSIIMHKINRTHSGVDFCYNMTVPVDETFSLNMTAAKWGDGGWKPNAFLFFSENVCQAVEKHVPKPFNDLRRALGQTVPKCPIEKGYYCAKDFIFELEALFPSMIYGKFRIDAVFLSNNVPFICFRVYANSVPSKGKSSLY